MKITPQRIPLAAPAPSGAFPFIFTDESGAVAREPSQPFYGIGLLKLSDAGRWHDGLNRILDRFVTAQQDRAKHKMPRAAYEFKFSKITSNTVCFYEELIDFYVRQPDGHFCALIVDRRIPGVEPLAACGTTWNALIKYSITLIRNNVGAGERPIVISDNFQKPSGDPQYYERQLVATLGPIIANVVMIESSSSMLLQLVDVLLGSVMYHFQIDAGKNQFHAGKKHIADRLAKAYSVGLLAPENMTRTNPNYLSVWPLKPRRQIRFPEQ